MKKLFGICIIACLLASCDNENTTPCSIRDLQLTAGACSSDSTYALTINFLHEDAGNASFDVFIRGNVLIGNYPLTSLPLTLPNFKKSGLEFDYIKVCINDNADCCAAEEILSPACLSDDCAVSDLTAVTGDCATDSTYSLTIDFEYSNPGNTSFDLFVRNNEFIGNYPLSSLPLTIPNFKTSGRVEDFIRVCINDQPDCCEAIEFNPPACLSDVCAISNLVLTQGDCTSDTTYSMTINFSVANPGNASFDVFVRNGVSIGFFPLSSLPVTIENFKVSGKDYDYVKVCVNDRPDCCKAEEILTKNCR